MQKIRTTRRNGVDPDPPSPVEPKLRAGRFPGMVTAGATKRAGAQGSGSPDSAEPHPARMISRPSGQQPDPAERKMNDATAAVPVDLSMTERDLGPYCPMYVDDILAGTQLYNATLFGAYHLLLYHQWKYGYIPRDLTACQTIARCDQVTVERILAPMAPERPKFVLHQCGGLVNPRMAAVRADRCEFVMEQRRKSALGVQARTRKAEPVDEPTGKPTGKPGGSPGAIPGPQPEALPPPLPLPSPSLRGSSSNQISLSPTPPDDERAKGVFLPLVQDIKAARPEFRRLNELAIVAELRTAEPKHLQECVRRFVADASNQESVKNPIGMLRAYMRPPRPQQGSAEDRAARDRELLKG